MENIIPMFIIFSYSVVMNSVAPLLKSFRELYSISLSISSLLPFFMLIGTVLSNLVVSIIINKLGVKKTIFTGIVITILGTFFIALSKSFALTLFGLLIFGFSTGFGFTGGTTLLAMSKNANYGFFHGAYGIGGMFAPFVIATTQKITGNFKDIYYFYTFLFSILLLVVMIKNPTEKSLKTLNEGFKIHQIKKAFGDKNFSFFLFILILYSSVEISTITWAGSTMNNVLFGLFASYSLFWLVFTISRFLTDIISKNVRNLVEINSIILSLALVLFIVTKHPIFFVLSGFFFGPIFPYVQQRGIASISSSLIPIFNGTTYALTSLGGSIASAIMGLTMERSLLVSWAIPLITINVMYTLSKKFLARS